ncbi:MAG: hypothetical protein ABSF69_02960 [Polyangiaceae bacterium]
MRTREVGRVVFMFLLVSLTGLTAASCGTSGEGSTFPPDGSARDSATSGVSDSATSGVSDSATQPVITGGEAGASQCVPQTCASRNYNCGMNGDGCTGTLDCGSCAMPEFCGGGGYSLCGIGDGGAPEGGAPDGSLTCTPQTCEDLGYDCGPASDGCNGILVCGEGPDGGPITLATTDAGVDGGATACPAPKYCGGGGYDRCGLRLDGGPQATCIPSTCEDLGYDCGLASDGCNGILACGQGPGGAPITLAADAGVDAGAITCPAPQYCGGGGYSRCGGPLDGGPQDSASATCTPQTCESLGDDCGPVGDGCGNILQCGSCAAPYYCGGAAPNRCGGSTGFGPDGGPICTPTTCAALEDNCGPVGDGCGNLLQCGSCTMPEFCGGAGPNKCGGSTGYGADGGPINTCVPTTCAALLDNCGPVGDGCGNLLQCGSCTMPEYCGGAGPNKCGGSTGYGADGGPVHPCTPDTCSGLGYNCGSIGDGCGNLLQCGVCGVLDTCGGAGTAGQCGHPCPGDGGLCPYQESCDGGTTTVLTGRVEAGISRFLNPNLAANPLPFPPDPVPNVLVYIPNSPLTAFTPGVTPGQCPQCAADVSGSPLVSTYTNYDGTFTLSGVPTPPAGTPISIVIQLGRWRREFQIATPTACTTSPVAPVGLPAGILNLPRNPGEGDIPLTAVSTGNVDALECVLLKLGVDQAQFTSNTPAAGTPLGRIHVYAGGAGSNGGNPGATVPNANPEASLMGTATYLNYDQILFPCWGAPATKTPAELANLVTYADSGGHFFATHYSYSWLRNNGEFNAVANWDIPNGTNDADNPGNGPWTLNVRPQPPIVAAPLHAGVFYQWLNYVCALSNSTGVCTPAAPYNVLPFNLPPPAGTGVEGPEVSIASPRFDVASVPPTSVDWIDGNDQNKTSAVFGDALVEHFTFNTPVPVADAGTLQCGHAIYSDFHVANVTVNTLPVAERTFPGECAPGFTPQEKILEYMLFDLASCVQPAVVACRPQTCVEQGLACGPSSDGCGNSLDCGTCPTGLSCGGGGTPGQCGAPEGGTCTPITCSEQHLSCGPAGDGCGDQIAGGCGTCPAGETCGGGGTPGVCGAPDAGACVPETCVQQHISCGPAGDGCGNLLQCGTCPAGQTCGGGGAPGVCGGGVCTPYTCMTLGYNCGPAGDGCGNLLQCGTCPAGETCGGGGHAGVCGSNGPR